MKNDPIPPQDHISRWCKVSHIDNGVVGITAFILEKKDHDDALSVNWLELLGYADRKSEIEEIQRILNQKMKKVSSNSLIAVLNVGQAIATVDNYMNGKLSITVLHNPDHEEGKWDDPSHSSIYGLTRNDDAQTAATALRDVIIETHRCNT